VHPIVQGGDHIPGVVAVLGANHDRIHHPEQGCRILEVPHAETLRGLFAAVLVYVGDADEICFVEVP
jgi:hypothetical protein